jgi:hypothetical protein
MAKKGVRFLKSKQKKELEALVAKFLPGCTLAPPTPRKDIPLPPHGPTMEEIRSKYTDDDVSVVRVVTAGGQEKTMLVSASRGIVGMQG